MEDAREHAVAAELDLDALRQRELDEVERLRDGRGCEVHRVEEEREGGAGVEGGAVAAGRDEVDELAGLLEAGPPDLFFFAPPARDDRLGVAAAASWLISRPSTRSPATRKARWGGTDRHRE